MVCDAVHRLLQISGLSPRQEYVIYKVFWQGCDYQEIADEFDVTRERVRQVYQKALRKLRSPNRISRAIWESYYA